MPAKPHPLSLLKVKTHEHIRPQCVELEKRLSAPRHVIQCIAGSHRVRNTTAVNQVVISVGLPYYFANADESALRVREWRITFQKPPVAFASDRLRAHGVAENVEYIGHFC